MRFYQWILLMRGAILKKRRYEAVKTDMSKTFQHMCFEHRKSVQSNVLNKRQGSPTMAMVIADGC